MPEFKGILRDPRLVLGIVLIIGGAILGAVLLSGQQTVPILRAKANIAPGSQVSAADFEIAELPASTGEVYLRQGEIPPEAVAALPIAAGELLSQKALVATSFGVDVVVPLLAPVPGSVAVGSEVGIWRIAHASFNTEASAKEVARAHLVALLSEGQTNSAHIRADSADIPAILEILGTGDAIVITGGK